MCNELVVTSKADRVISEEVAEVGVPAADAHAIARITYRQLDHWARQGWVRPSLDPGKGRAGRRRYSKTDVVRLDLLRHLASSGVNLTVVGPIVATLDMPLVDLRMVWGPLGTREEQPRFAAMPPSDIAAVIERRGSWVVYSPVDAIERFDTVAGTHPATNPNAEESAERRRSA